MKINKNVVKAGASFWAGVQLIAIVLGFLAPTRLWSPWPMMILNLLFFAAVAVLFAYLFMEQADQEIRSERNKRY